MNDIRKQSFLTRALKWFDPRGRSVNTLAFILNRITGLGLTLYLYLHLIMLGNLAKGPEAYDGFIAFVHNPLFIFGEILVVMAGLMHGLNGCRIALNSLGIGIRQQKSMLYIAFGIAILGSIYFIIRMVTA